MRVLIIHHLEPMWESGHAQFGDTFESLSERFVDHLLENEYDNVILTQFEHWEPQNEHVLTGIAQFVNQWEEYSYGWHLDSFGDYAEPGIDFCKGGYHSEAVALDPWLKNLKGSEVYISGAFDGECIDDLETALEFLKIPYHRIEDLIL